MALTWDWNKRCGTITMENKGKEMEVSLYEGNAMLIMLYEYKENDEDMYLLYGFFADETHMKRCLGIAKDYDNLHKEIRRIKINKARHSDWKKIVTAFAQAYDNITIEIVNEE